MFTIDPKKTPVCIHSKMDTNFKLRDRHGIEHYRAKNEQITATCNNGDETTWMDFQNYVDIGSIILGKRSRHKLIQRRISFI